MAEVRGGLEKDEVTVEQSDIDAAVARAVARASEELRVLGRRPLNAGAQTVAFPKKRSASKGEAEIGGVKVAVAISIVDPARRGGDDEDKDVVSYIDDTGQPQAASRKDFAAAEKDDKVQGAEVAKDRAKK